MIKKTPIWMLSMKSLVGLILITLSLICGTVSTATEPTQAQRDSVRLILVKESMIRRATAVIDSLDLQLGLANNRVAVRDSALAKQRTWFEGQYTAVYDWGEHWRKEATSFWNQNKSAIFTFLGMLAAAIALR